MKTILKSILFLLFLISSNASSQSQDTCEYPSYTYYDPATKLFITYCPVGAHPNGLCYIPCPEQ